MKLVKVGEGTPYQAPQHNSFWGIRKLDPETGTKNITVAISHFLPEGGAENSSSPLERVYFCLEGKVTVKGKNEEYTLEQGDLIYIANGEERSFHINNTKTATLLVLMSKVQ